MTALINVFFILIIGFFLFVTHNDVLRFFKGRTERAQRKETEELWLDVPESGASLSPGRAENKGVAVFQWRAVTPCFALPPGGIHAVRMSSFPPYRTIEGTRVACSPGFSRRQL